MLKYIFIYLKKSTFTYSLTFRAALNSKTERHPTYVEVNVPLTQETSKP